MEPIAIVGFSFRLPDDVDNEGSFWETLQQRQNLVKPWPESRLNAAGCSTDGKFPDGACLLKHDIATFDAPFFSTTPAEAAAMDPQHRWALESSYHALENAGIGIDTLIGSKTAVFASSLSNDYRFALMKDGQSLPRTTMTGTYPSMLANRVSWFYNLMGPSILVDTACSGSMVALDSACQSINSGDASMALVIGSNLILNPEFIVAMSSMNFLSPDGRCYSFDSRANGYGRGEGILTLVIKPLSAAVENGDNIRALIRATGSNQDGRTPGITMPSQNAQEQLIRHVYQKASLDLSSTRYVEAHGTGTPAGDPIEMNAIGKAFGSHRSADEPLYVGSVKSNIGHLEGGAGLAGVVKTVMLLERGIIPPVALFEKLNPAIEAEKYHVEVPTQAIPWPSQGLRRASVNSFGFGGTNSHVILDDACHYLHEHGLAGHHKCNLVNGDKKRVNGAQEPANGVQKPINGTQKPVNGIHKPVNGIHKPVNGIHKPVNGLVNGSQKPVNGIQKPVNGVQKPINGIQEMVNGVKDLVNGAQKLVNGAQKLVNGIPEPITGVQELVNGAQELVNGAQELVNGIQEPVNGIHKPVNGTQEPTNGVQELVNDVQEPVNGAQESANGAPKCSVPKLLVWSASNEAGLGRVVDGYKETYESIVDGKVESLDQLAYTLSSRRSKLDWRNFAVVTSANIIPGSGEAPVSMPVRASAKTSIGFVFTGQGAAYAEMGKELLLYPVFEKALLDMDTIYSELGCQWSLFDELSNPDHINLPEYSQPICTALQIALVELLREFNILPSAVVGHSSGEIAAAYAIGALSQRSAGIVAYYRGKLAGELKASLAKPGAMMAVNMGETEVEEYIRTAAVDLEDGANVSVACVNSLVNCTLAGSEASLDALGERLKHDGYFARKLTTGVAYHSSAMTQMADEYTTLMGGLEPGVSPIDGPTRMFSSVTGDIVDSSQLSQPQYWVDNLTNTVKFSQALISLLEPPSKDDGQGPITDLIEVGPHSTLQRPVRDTISGSGVKVQPRYQSLLQRFRSPLHSVLETAGDLFCRGCPVSVLAANLQIDKKPSPMQDLPPYPFDQSLTYWVESRLSRNTRVPDKTQLSILGRPFFDWNPLQPRWRNFLDTKKYPWLPDHGVQGAIVFPGAGSLAMTIQAVRQIVLPNDAVTGFLIKEASFLNPIVINDERGSTETMVQLLPVQKSHEKDASLFHAQIYAYHDNNWTKCLSATIQVQYDQGGTEIDDGKEQSYDLDRLQARHQDVSNQCAKDLDSRKFYSLARDAGIVYGRTFQLLSDIKWNETDSARASLEPLADHPFIADGFLHPTTLDATFQLVLASLSKGLSQKMQTWIPTRISNTWVSANLMEETPLEVTCTLGKPPGSNMHTSTSAIRVVTSNGAPLIEIEEMLLTATSSVDQSTKSALPLHGLEWKPQLSLLSKEQLGEVCQINQMPEGAIAADEFYKLYSAAFVLCLRKALRETRAAGRKDLPNFLKRYLASVLPLAEDGSVDCLGYTEDDIETMLQRCDEKRPLWKLGSAVARNIGPIISSQVDPLEVFFKDDSSEKFYSSMFNQTLDFRFLKFLDLVSHEKPSLRILEVGAGTGGMTEGVLSGFKELEGKDGTSRFYNYTYTDISPSFFEKARVKFAEFEHRMVFRTLDLEKEVSEQGFSVGTYDMVIAGSVLHATSDLNATLSNLRRLLKPGGHLLNFEIVQPHMPWIEIMWGLVPGWWASKEEDRQYSPLITEKQWEKHLVNTGYSGLDLVVKDYEEHDSHLWSLIVSSAVAEKPQTNGSTKHDKLVILVDPEISEQTAIAELILSRRDGIIISIKDTDDTTWTETDIIISLVEVGRSLLTAATESDFQWLKQTVLKATNLLWVASTSAKDHNGSPAFAIQGFFRSIGLEAPLKKFIALVIENPEDSVTAEAATSHVVQVVEAAFGEYPSEDTEYVVHDGLLTTGRLVKDVEAHDRLQKSLSPQIKMEQWLPGAAVKLQITRPGDLESLQFVEDTTYHMSDLAPEDIEIEARAWPVNFRDVLIALNRMENDGLGFECAGIVTRLGSACDLDVSPGDRVVIVGANTLRTYARGHYKSVLKIPEHLSFEHATSMINPAATAIHSLVSLARLRKGESILIHSAAGSTGQMAIYVAQMLGATIYATVSSETKKQFLIDTFNIPADHIFYSRNTSFAKGIKRISNGYGVDVILNSLSGNSLQASLECMAPFGRFVEIGKTDIIGNSDLPMGIFKNNVSFFGVDLFHISRSNLDLMQELLTSVYDFLSRGIIQAPQPIRVYPMSEFEAAFRHVQSGKHAGRAVLSVNPSEIVPKLLSDQHPCSFDPDAAYVIAGGLGGLGRSIAAWMVSRGAKNLILLSRSGTSASPAAAQLVSTLRDRGARIETPRCDASKLDELKKALEFSQTMPPIKGCINATMALQNTDFSQMSYAEWNTTIQSKVASSWNLHSILPQDVEFFILLSSLAGVQGAPAQSNYATGCVYQDALARYRVKQGLRGTSLDVGWMRTVGIVSETESYARVIESTGNMAPIEEEELLAILGIYCAPNRSDAKIPGAQLLMGMRTAADYISNGKKPSPQMVRPMFATFASPTGKTASDRQDQTVTDFSAALQQASSPGQKQEIITQALIEKLARSLSVSSKDIDDSKSLSAYGIDSLVAVELRNWIAQNLHATLTVFELLSNQPITGIAGMIMERSTIVHEQKVEAK